MVGIHAMDSVKGAVASTGHFNGWRDPNSINRGSGLVAVVSNGRGGWGVGGEHNIAEAVVLWSLL